MLDYYPEQDQENRVKEAIAPVEKANRNSVLIPRENLMESAELLPNKNWSLFEAYWQGYVEGITSYWLKEYQSVIC
ncbi:MAG: hypothetical protein QNJ70_25295 [Xenococcaceae cyanobacterium MO_207.B15]|nr:hypothetical protein [Xenococcaceae cyanobacterium MO_207.B15]